MSMTIRLIISNQCIYHNRWWWLVVLGSIGVGVRVLPRLSILVYNKKGFKKDVFVVKLCLTVSCDVMRSQLILSLNDLACYFIAKRCKERQRKLDVRCRSSSNSSLHHPLTHSKKRVRVFPKISILSIFI